MTNFFEEIDAKCGEEMSLSGFLGLYSRTTTVWDHRVAESIPITELFIQPSALCHSTNVSFAR
ncbi:MAG: hypothetical protein ACAF41_28805 [Leptolyngbya sp. BL-A-14]